MPFKDFGVPHPHSWHRHLSRANTKSLLTGSYATPARRALYRSVLRNCALSFFLALLRAVSADSTLHSSEQNRDLLIAVSTRTYPLPQFLHFRVIAEAVRRARHSWQHIPLRDTALLQYLHDLCVAACLGLADKAAADLAALAHLGEQYFCGLLGRYCWNCPPHQSQIQCSPRGAASLHLAVQNLACHCPPPGVKTLAHTAHALGMGLIRFTLARRFSLRHAIEQYAFFRPNSNTTPQARHVSLCISVVQSDRPIGEQTRPRTRLFGSYPMSALFSNYPHSGCV